MIILSIETSCDETAVAILECIGNPKDDTFSYKILGNALYSQISSHQEFGGVVPMIAKREHAKKLIPLFKKALSDANLSASYNGSLCNENLDEIFGREEEFKNDFVKMLGEIPSLSIDAIAVTEGPGLEPALWMGIIFAKALSVAYNLPLIPVNHMEGHILSVLPEKITFPALSLLISGGHTELVLMEDWGKYKIIGKTRDDAIGEAYDKVARMLDLPYPGGPKISHLAELQRKTKTSTPEYVLPRPMLHSKDFDFSFSGIKTAVLYSLKNTKTPIVKETVAKEFEDAVTEVLISKTFKAAEEYNVATIIIGGGVIANSFIRKNFEEKASEYSNIRLLMPSKDLQTDNALMIGIAGYVRYILNVSNSIPKAQGNLGLTNS